MKINLPTIKCQRCGYTWTPRKSKISLCAKCKNPLEPKKKGRRGFMKNASAIILVFLCGGMCYSDTLQTKEGKLIEWKSVADQGETYDVVTMKGERISVKKSDIEKLSGAGSDLPILTGATFTKLQGKIKTVNGFGAIDPKRDLYGSVGIEAKVAAGVMTMDLKSDNPTRLAIPVKLTEEYDFTITVERKEGVGDFYIGLMGKGRPFLLRFDSDSGIHTGIQGAKMVDTGKQVFQKDKPSTVECFVRHESVIVKLDGKEIVNWKADWTQVQMPDSHALPEGRTPPFIGSQKIPLTYPNLWKIHKLEIREVQ
jgi:hypothetical protein